MASNTLSLAQLPNPTLTIYLSELSRERAPATLGKLVRFLADGTARAAREPDVAWLTTNFLRIQDPVGPFTDYKGILDKIGFWV